jgi:hypothetical protein
MNPEEQFYTEAIDAIVEDVQAAPMHNHPDGNTRDIIGECIVESKLDPVDPNSDAMWIVRLKELTVDDLAEHVQDRNERLDLAIETVAYEQIVSDVKAKL